MKVVVIGGVAGGASFAARYRRLDKKSEITIIDRGEYISFANCGLPYYVGNVIDDRAKLFVHTPESMKEKFNIDVKIKNEVLKIDPSRKAVSVKNLLTGDIYEEPYDKLVIATGSSPLKPPIPGIDGNNIFTLWTIPDTDKVKNHIEKTSAKKAAVIGGGFIGIEMAENLHALGIEVSIIEMADQVMAPLDKEMAEYLHAHLKDMGVNLILEDGVKEFLPKENKTVVVTATGKKIEADLIILSIGIKPNSVLAKDAGLTIGQRGGIVVDKAMVTSNPDIYAVGDVIEVEDFVNKVPTMIPLAGPANKQGRIAANNLAGIADYYSGTQGTAAVKIFELIASSTGTNEKTLQKLGKVKGSDYEIIKIDASNHAEYYPGDQTLHIKVIFSLSDGKILGAQIVGGEGTDKRIDILATAIRLDGRINDLKELELAYAPPYSTSKDPINIIGFISEKFFD
jgi:NADPH-dependent 2,4-dienoyl-CoA reductase/sulfur reductase-like enzyme